MKDYSICFVNAFSSPTFCPNIYREFLLVICFRAAILLWKIHLLVFSFFTLHSPAYAVSGSILSVYFVIAFSSSTFCLLNICIEFLLIICFRKAIVIWTIRLPVFSILYFTVARIRCIRRQSIICQEIQSLYMQVSDHLLGFVISVYSSTQADQRYGERLHRLLYLIYRWLCRRHSLVS